MSLISSKKLILTDYNKPVIGGSQYLNITSGNVKKILKPYKLFYINPGVEFQANGGTCEDFITTAANQDFCLEFYVKPYYNGSTQVLFYIDFPSTQNYRIYQSASNVFIQINMGGVNRSLVWASPANNTWANFRLLYNHTNLLLYRNENLVNTYAETTDFNANAASSFIVNTALGGLGVNDSIDIAGFSFTTFDNGTGVLTNNFPALIKKHAVIESIKRDI